MDDLEIILNNKHLCGVFMKIHEVRKYYAGDKEFTDYRDAEEYVKYLAIRQKFKNSLSKELDKLCHDISLKYMDYGYGMFATSAPVDISDEVIKFIFENYSQIHEVMSNEVSTCQ